MSDRRGFLKQFVAIMATPKIVGLFDTVNEVMAQVPAVESAAVTGIDVAAGCMRILSMACVPARYAAIDITSFDSAATSYAEGIEAPATFSVEVDSPHTPQEIIAGVESLTGIKFERWYYRGGDVSQLGTRATFDVFDVDLRNVRPLPYV